MIKEILSQVYEYGLEKFAGDEIQADEFLEGFLKEAAAAGMFSSGAGKMMNNILEGGATALGKGVIGFGLGLAAHGVASTLSGMGNANLHEKFTKVLADVRTKSPLLKNADRGKVDSYAETIFKFAPHVAIDPNLLTAILSNAVHGEGIDPMTIRTLSDLEEKYTKSRQGALFSPKAYV